MKCRIIGLGLCLALAFSAAAQSRLQLKAQEVEMSGDYTGAIALYRKDMSKNGKSAAALEGTARCYLALSDFAQAEDYFAQLVEKSGQPAHRMAYAEAMMRSAKYAEATKMAKEAAAADTSLQRRADRLTAAADRVSAASSGQARYAAINLAEVNTCYSEWGAQLYSPHKMIFVSDRPMENPRCEQARPKGASIAGGYTALGRENDSLFLTDWSEAKMMPYPFTDKRVQVAPIAVVPNDTATLYYTRTSSKSVSRRKKVGRETINELTYNLEIYSVRQTDYGWELVTPFEHNNPKQYSVMAPFLSPDGKTLYFASDMPGGMGGYDIWLSEQQTNGAWGKPVNPGKPVNTPGNESFPTLSPDGTLYFSSTGHAGMGGLDIFSTKKVKNRWQPVEHLQAPFNSSADDFYYVVGKDSVGYLSSNRAGGKGSDDIYLIAPLPLRSRVAKPEPEPVDTTPAVDSLPAIDSLPTVADTAPVVDSLPAPADTAPVVTVADAPPPPQR